MKVYMVGNAHLDPVWLWRWDEGSVEAISTCLTALRLMEKHREFIFTRGERWIYELIEKFYPEEFEKIKRFVRQKRWIVVNGWIVQPDMNVPSGESFVRQALYGKKYFREKFGIEPTVAYCVDSFGHAGTMPQILKKCGYKGFVFMRPHPHELTLPQLFIWRSCDGSEILAFRLAKNYETFDIEKLKINIEETQKVADPSIPVTMCFYGVGNHGGGPTEEQIEFIKKNANYKKGVELVFGDPLRYFKEVEKYRKKLKKIEGELHHHAVGCYSVNLEIKRTNRKAENLLLDTEALATIASREFGLPYPHNKFEYLWLSLLFNQFHDILGGTTIREGFLDFKNEMGKVLHIAEKIKVDSMLTIMKHVNTDGDGVPFIVFNPTGRARKEYIEFEPWLNWRPYDKAVLIDPDGREVPFVYIKPASLVRNMIRILFKAEVPPFGYAVYWFRRGEAKEFKGLEYGRNYVENEFLRLEIKEKELRVKFKEHGDIFDENGFQVAEIVEDGSDTWGHGVYRFDGRKREMETVELKFIEKTPLKATIKRVSRCGNTTLREYISVYAGEPYIRTRFVVDYHEKLTVFKIAYRFAKKIERIHSEIPYGFAERQPDGLESPMQRQVYIKFNGAGEVGLANDGLYAYDAIENSFRITVLRCVPFAWHVPYKLAPDEECEYIDEGMREFELIVWPFKERRGEDLRYLQILNRPLIALSAVKSKGKLPAKHSFLDVHSSPNVLVEVLKMNEDGSTVLRMFETMGKEGSIEVEGRRFTVSPFEIKTIVLNQNEIRESAQCL